MAIEWLQTRDKYKLESAWFGAIPNKNHVITCILYLNHSIFIQMFWCKKILDGAQRQMLVWTLRPWPEKYLKSNIFYFDSIWTVLFALFHSTRIRFLAMKTEHFSQRHIIFRLPTLERTEWRDSFLHFLSLDTIHIHSFTVNIYIVVRMLFLLLSFWISYSSKFASRKGKLLLPLVYLYLLLFRAQACVI